MGLCHGTRNVNVNANACISKSLLYTCREASQVNCYEWHNSVTASYCSRKPLTK
jgi:hypothetical protein